jgi:hypothetical protein
LEVEVKMVEKWNKKKESLVKLYGFSFLKREYNSPNQIKSEQIVLKENPIVCVLALNRNDRVVLLKKFYCGPEKILFQLPFGNIEKDEYHGQAADRILCDQTGYKGDLIYVSRFFDRPLMTSQTIVYIALDCVRCKNVNIDELCCDIYKVSIEELKKRVLKGDIINTASVLLALQYLKK